MATLITQPGQPAGGRRESRAPIFWGVVLVGAGVLFLAMTLGVLPNPTAGGVGVVFAVLGFALLASYLALHAHWWTLITGSTLLGLGAVILLPQGADGWIFLASVGLGFALVALTKVERWWAVIPAGTLLTLALVAGIGPAIGGVLAGTLLFFGLAATFGILALLRVRGRPMRWPLIVAAACFIFGVLIATTGPISDVVWPLTLVAAGVVLLIGGLTRRRPS